MSKIIYILEMKRYTFYTTIHRTCIRFDLDTWSSNNFVSIAFGYSIQFRFLIHIQTSDYHCKSSDLWLRWNKTIIMSIQIVVTDLNTYIIWMCVSVVHNLRFYCNLYMKAAWKFLWIEAKIRKKETNRK